MKRDLLIVQLHIVVAMLINNGLYNAADAVQEAIKELRK